MLRKSNLYKCGCKTEVKVEDKECVTPYSRGMAATDPRYECPIQKSESRLRESLVFLTPDPLHAHVQTMSFDLLPTPS